MFPRGEQHEGGVQVVLIAGGMAGDRLTSATMTTLWLWLPRPCRERVPRRGEVRPKARDLAPRIPCLEPPFGYGERA